VKDLHSRKRNVLGSDQHDPMSTLITSDASKINQQQNNSILSRKAVNWFNLKGKS